MKKAAALFCLIIITIAIKAQGIMRVDGYKNPWVGGLNACQFGQIDLNGNGKNDLVVFDRHGNRLLTYLNEGGQNEVNYIYAPEYQQYFPHIDDWLILADYDGDGFNDIFTYSKGWAGIKAFRNTGATPPRFEQVTSNYLTSLQNGGEVNILATNADYPAIIDLDGDGDLDILTFWVLGTFIEKHQNMSIERYGTADSLVFEKAESCWGMIAESEEDNALYLDTCLFGKTFYTSGDPTRHRGATFAVRDLNGDGLLDLLLGDVDYPSLTKLINDGTTQTAVMASQTDIFPENDPIRLFSMPLPFFGDINNDGLTDMIVSPFDPNGLSCEGANSIWLYLNTGTNENPNYILHTKSFLQHDMIDIGTGAYPFFCDINNDGKTDLIAGTIGDITSTYYQYGSLKTERTAKITYFANTGETNNPVLQLASNDLSSLSELKTTHLTPTAADINSDNRLEYIFGTADGNIILADNNFNITDTNFLDFSKPYSAPCLFDVNGDGIYDLVIGHQDGKLSFYKGYSANGSTGFEFITHNWGNVDVRDYNTSFFGHSTPCLFRNNGETLLLVGSEQGKLFLFSNISDDANSTFNDISATLGDLFENFKNDFGYMAAPAVADIDNDGIMELVVGNFGGGLQLFNSIIEVNHSIESHQTARFTISPNPANDIVRITSSHNKAFRIVIADLAGQNVATQQATNGTTEVDISQLPQGFYLISLICGDSVETKKIIKL